MLSIVIPDDINLLDTLPDDFHELAERLSNAPRRSCLSFEEKITAYVLETLDEGQSPPAELYMTISWAISKRAMISDSPRMYGDLPDHEMTMKVTEMVMSGKSDIFGANKTGIIWKFSALITNPLRVSTGSIRFAVSLKNPHMPSMSSNVVINKDDIIDDIADRDHDTDHDIGDIDNHDIPNPDISKTPDMSTEKLESQKWSRPENLLEQLNHLVSGNTGPTFNFSLGQKDGTRNGTQDGAHNENPILKTPDLKTPDHSADGLLGSVRNVSYTRATMSQADSAVLDLDTAVALSLKLKSVKPVGRNDILISTLRMEGTDKFVNLGTRARANNIQYSIEVLSVNASLKGGKVAQLGSNFFPCRLGLTDLVCVSYRLSDIDASGINPNHMPYAPAFTPGSVPGTPISGASTTTTATTNTNTKTPLPDLPGMKAMEIRVEFRIQRVDPESGDHVTVVHQTTRAMIPLFDMASPIPPSKATLSQPRRAATNLPPPKKSVTINNVVSYGHSSPSERFSATTLSSPILIQGRNQSKRKPLMSVGSLSAHNSSVTVNITSSQPSALNGLVLTFTGDFSICVGVVVTWKVQVVNKAGRPLQTSLQFREPKGTGFLPTVYSRNSQSTVSLGQFSGGDDDRNLFSQGPHVHQYLRQRPEKQGILMLSNDVGLGHLDSSQVFETELKLLGLSKGVYTMAGLRLVESSGDAVDFGRFLEVFVT